jgi:hypothetical protein
MKDVISLHDIAAVLRRYRGRYQYLDVFSHHVRELCGPTPTAALHPLGGNRYGANVGSDHLDLETYPGKGIVRCSLSTSQPRSNDVVAAAAIGALVGLGARPKSPDGLILGMLLGGLAGAALGKNEIDENRVMTLRYEPTSNSWRVYHGPYLQWAKAALRPA